MPVSSLPQRRHSVGTQGTTCWHCSGGIKGRSCLSCPGWPPRLRLDLRLAGGGLSCGWDDEGGLDELVESLPSLASSSATRAVSQWMRATTSGGSLPKTSGGRGAGASIDRKSVV